MRVVQSVVSVAWLVQVLASGAGGLLGRDAGTGNCSNSLLVAIAIRVALNVMGLSRRADASVGDRPDRLARKLRSRGSRSSADRQTSWAAGPPQNTRSVASHQAIRSRACVARGEDSALQDTRARHRRARNSPPRCRPKCPRPCLGRLSLLIERRCTRLWAARLGACWRTAAADIATQTRPCDSIRPAGWAANCCRRRLPGRWPAGSMGASRLCAAGKVLLRGGEKRPHNRQSLALLRARKCLRLSSCNPFSENYFRGSQGCFCTKPIR